MNRVAIALAIATALLLPAVAIGAPTAVAQEPEDSAVTVQGTGDFDNLSITVSQTENLVNQTIKINWTWTGTETDYRGEFAFGNFLQIMQCWGDDPLGPDRTQCQFGATPDSKPASGASVAERGSVDPTVAGELQPPPDDPTTGYPESSHRYVPFWPFDRSRPTLLAADGRSDFYDAQITNEVPVALTRADGTGEVEFEVQTLQQSGGLGCGTPVAGTDTSRPCWLVVVPRGATSVDGTPVTSVPIKGSPLDVRAWKDRIAIKLDFVPQRDPCAFGVQTPIAGHELALDAIVRWQPALCVDDTSFSYARTNDQLARGQVTTTDPELAVVSRPVPPEQLQPGRPLVYAPIAASGLTFAYNVTQQPPSLLPQDDPRRALIGRPFTEMTLNARLVAKMLTQSYRAALAGEGQAVGAGNPTIAAREARLADNPVSLQSDPEFLELNPTWRDLIPTTPALEPLVATGVSDVTAQLWDWILADPDARAFVNGTPDGYPARPGLPGMVVNPLNQGLEPPVQSFPREDQLCVPGNISPGGSPPAGFALPYCPLDLWPFVDDFNAGGRNAARADTRGRQNAATYNPATRSARFSELGRQSILTRAVLVVVDVATADRYRLPTAQLETAPGVYARPNATGLAAGLADMEPSGVDGVVVPDPTPDSSAAYPLTTLSYAVTSPYNLQLPDAQAYGKFLRYAGGPGQVPGEQPGQLPPGYLPLPEAMRAQTLAAADTIERLSAAGPPPSPTPTPPAPATPGGTAPPAGTGATTTSGTTGSGTTGATGTATSGTGGAGSGTTPTTPAGDVPAAPVPPADPAAAAPQAVALSQPTPSVPAQSFVGALLVALLIGGGLAAVLAPVAHLLGQRLTPRGGGEADRASTA